MLNSNDLQRTQPLSRHGSLAHEQHRLTVSSMFSGGWSVATRRTGDWLLSL